MTETSSLPLNEPSAEAEKARLAIRRIAMIALLAILLGLFMQGLILAAKLASGGPFPGALLLVDIVSGVTWSLFVCTGVGIGTSVIKARAALAGLIALIAAPIAIGFAKASQKVMATLLGAAEQQAVLSLASISALRAIEYGALGWLLATLTRKEKTGALPYFGTGLAIGVVFGGAIAALNYQVALANGLDPALPQIAGSLVNEVVSPIGCALLIYIAQFVGANLRLVQASQA